MQNLSITACFLCVFFTARHRRTEGSEVRGQGSSSMRHAGKDFFLKCLSMMSFFFLILLLLSSSSSSSSLLLLLLVFFRLRNSIRLLFTSVVVPGLAVLSCPVSNMVCCLYGSDAGCAEYGVMCDVYGMWCMQEYALSECEDVLPSV